MESPRDQKSAAVERAIRGVLTLSFGWGGARYQSLKTSAVLRKSLSEVYLIVWTAVSTSKRIGANLFGINAKSYSTYFLRRKSRGDTPCQLLNALEKEP